MSDVTSQLFSKHVNRVAVFGRAGLVGIILVMSNLPAQAATILSNNVEKNVKNNVKKNANTNAASVYSSTSVIQQLPDPLSLYGISGQPNAQYASNQLYVPSITSVELLKSDGSQAGNQFAQSKQKTGQTLNQPSYPSLKPSSKLSNLSANPSVSSESLPNAYALVKRLNEQEKLMAEQQRQLEDLTYQYQQDIEQLMARLEYVEQQLDGDSATSTAKVANKERNKGTNNQATKKATGNTRDANSKSKNTSSNMTIGVTANKNNNDQWVKPNDSLTNASAINSRPEQGYRTQPANGSTQQPVTRSINTRSINTPPINMTSLVDPETAYTQALQFYSRDDVEAAIAQMQAFLMQYPTHQLTPNAVYWLGEFHLKTQPANYKQATAYFTQVVDAFSDSPNNDKQSKSLFRLVQLSLLTEKNANEQNKKMQGYLQRLTTQYPNSKESKRALELVR